jgi:DNA invertase Pin-like site-specific DNA recombinase
MLIGYARISTPDQNLDLQCDALKAAGCERIFTDQMSGARGDRPGLAQALCHARGGDTLVVWRLDRLGRSVRDLIEIVTDLERRGIGFKSLTETIDTATPNGRLVFYVFGALAEAERQANRDRTIAGLRAARARGRVGGRPRAMTPEKVDAAERLLRDGTPPRDVAAIVGVSLPTLYRWVPAGKSADSIGR